MNQNKQFRRGMIGAIVAAICCFTPLLVIVVAGVGLSAITGWLDYALFPLLFASLGVMAHALWVQAGRPGQCPKNPIIAGVVVLSALLFWLEFRFALRLSIGAVLALLLYAVWLRRAAPERSDP